ncbi:MAG TPA: stage 0 sporulation family protein [Chloroflexia bacterium]|nr:stage 0 sporulation family protein [Chloroflexia bacterium]
MATPSDTALIRTVAVRFKTAGKLQYFDAGDLELAPDDWVIVDMGRSSDAARVVLPPRVVEATQLGEPLKPVIRLATEEDLTRMLSLKARNREALKKCAERVKLFQLPMRLVDAEFNHDAARLTFYFTADGRVDFRQLVRDLASIFRTRIELRQIGVRDKAKMVGGVGKCGKTLCCSTWMTDFPPVSVKTAKDQDLPLNPSHITGECGRLLCCLRFEQDLYNEMKKDMPVVGERVCGSEGHGTVIARNILKGAVTVGLDSGVVSESNFKELTREEKDAATLVGGYDPATEDVFEIEDEGDLRFLEED